MTGDTRQPLAWNSQPVPVPSPVHVDQDRSPSSKAIPAASTPSPAHPQQPNTDLAAPPTFWGSFRGMWLLTWKRKVSWRQMPIHAAALLAIPLLAALTLGRDEAGTNTYFWSLLSLYLQVILPLFCLTIFGDLIREELQANTLVFLTTRPLTRAQLFLAKFLCLLIWVEGLALGNGLLLLLIGAQRGVEAVPQLILPFLSSQLLAVMAFGALSAFLGLIHKRYLVLGLLYGIVVETGIGQIPTNINTLSLTRHLRVLMANHPLLADHFNWPTEGTMASILALAIGTVLFLCLAVILFSLKELLPGDEMHK